MAMMCHEGKGKPGMEKFDPSIILRDKIPYLPSEPKNAVLEAQHRTALETERLRRSNERRFSDLEEEVKRLNAVLENERAESRSASRKENFKWWITTGIAVASLAVSILTALNVL